MWPPSLDFYQAGKFPLNLRRMQRGQQFQADTQYLAFLTCIFDCRQISLISAIFWYSLCGIVKLSRPTFTHCSFPDFSAVDFGVTLFSGFDAGFALGRDGVLGFLEGGFLVFNLADFLVVILFPSY